jgi:hypothetical protein
MHCSADSLTLSAISKFRGLIIFSLIDASKEVGLEVNAEKTKYMLLSRQQNAGKKHIIEITNMNVCFENVAQCNYLGTTVTKI